MNSIDWRKAPADATHACPGAHGYSWRKKEGDNWYMWYHRGWQRVFPIPELYKSRPVDAIVANAREVAVSEMLRTLKTPLPEATVYALYDAGYRKVQP